MNKLSSFAALLIGFIVSAPLYAADMADPIADSDAIQGVGEIRLSSFIIPKSLNYYLDNNSFSAEIFSMMYESLLANDPITADYAPGIAKHWEISKDKKQFTFFIDPTAKWSDGKPITAEDVLWTFDTIMCPTNQTGPHKVALRTFTVTKPEILPGNAIRFTADEVHWRNLDAAGGFAILPKHVFENKDFNKVSTVFPVVSGPYIISELKEQVSLTLKRRSDWWARLRSSSRNTYNFEKITYRFYSDQNNAFDAFLNNQVDVYPVYKAAIWKTKTSGDKFTSNWIVKRKIKNHHPVGFQGFAMNLRRAPFDDIRVRKALAMLLNRKRMNETLMHNEYFLHRSYFEGIYDISNKCHNVFFEFKPAEAEALLDEAGWKRDAKTGNRVKDGKPLSFTFLSRDKDSEKFLALFSEDLNKAGIQMKIETKDWAAWARDMDEFNFDMTWAAWSGGIFNDPEGMWSSEEADRKGSSNITGFKNEKVDALIKSQREIFSLQARNAILCEIDSTLTENVPYILLWNIDYTRLLYWDKFGTPATVLSKFGNENSICTYWWFDEDSAAELESAVESGEILPPRPDTIDFDLTFGK